ncbi:hypothetical protein AP064_04005 [Candidatus Liberibacter solanacearum]|uniref:BRO family protein n=1 Tax=Candidatus Liberibacter solanacearum TaxID=556287 RepID=UPI0005FA5993|nr:BRO family protein [Candidatus Liberibacter solanacearum]KJZ81213.1 hypothetical protein KP07_01645 [Candidatus Liberibacter solanacearum]KQC48950.1 hypothetical protein AP064_04005 [Candidatus Liberibacter solanacearum]
MLCKGVVKYHPLKTEGGTQKIRIITEPDVYRLIIKSKLESANNTIWFVAKDIATALGYKDTVTAISKTIIRGSPVAIPLLDCRRLLKLWS